MKDIYHQSEIFGSLRRAVEILEPKKHLNLFSLNSILDRAISDTRRELQSTMEEIPFPLQPTLSRYSLDTTIEIFSTLARMPFYKSRTIRQLAAETGINERSTLVAESFLFVDPKIENPFDINEEYDYPLDIQLHFDPDVS